jgi:hypothetical protein
VGESVVQSAMAHSWKSPLVGSSWRKNIMDGTPQFLLHMSARV